ncbi:meiotic nuclear division protein 1 [Tribonema minus]|uniref:Meiotic nuclear division protein 1 n=1 Tax=Tribonema minus TaxID=303371 RepID=A0A835YU23_9STRA|nr:meiotic nuclear division protein 1 [Tribonema minus]
MVRKALSVDEKKERLLSIFHTTKEVLNLKELEKHAGRAGIVTNTVKDVNAELVNDGIVDSDKIGASNFFWAFPSKAVLTHVNNIASLKEQIETTHASLEDAKRKGEELGGARVDPSLGEELRGTRVDCDERRAKLQRLAEEREREAALRADAEQLKRESEAALRADAEQLREREAALRADVEQLKENDPKELERVRAEVEGARERANLWTDNLWAIKAFMVKKQGLTGKEVDRMLGLKEDFDYV